jgi:hypothetical protein
MAYNSVSLIGGGVAGIAGVSAALADIDTTARFRLGTRMRANNATYGQAEFIYLKGVASTAIGDLVVYDGNAKTTTRAVAGSRGPAAVACGAIGANQFGWYQIAGTASMRAATVAANGNVYLTASAGQVDDAVVSGDKVDGARFKTADGTPAAGLALAELAFPSCNANG